MSLSGGLAGNGRATLLALPDLGAGRERARRPARPPGAARVLRRPEPRPALVPGIYTKLIDVDKVDIVTSPYATAMIAPAMPVVMQRNMCFVTLFGAGVNEAFKYDRHFNMNITGDDIKETYAKGYFDVASHAADAAAQRRDPRRGQRVRAEGRRERAPPRAAARAARRLRPLLPADARWTSRRPSAPSRRRGRTWSSSPPTRRIPAASCARRASCASTRRMFGGGDDRAADRGRPGAARPDPEQPGQLGRLLARADHATSPASRDFQEKYRAQAPREQTDLLGNYMPPYAYAQMQVLEQTVTRVGRVDQAAMAADMHANEFDTIVGEFRFSASSANGRRSATSTSSSRTSATATSRSTSGPGTKVILYRRTTCAPARCAPYGPPAPGTSLSARRWTPTSSLLLNGIVSGLLLGGLYAAAASASRSPSACSTSSTSRTRR